MIVIGKPRIFRVKFLDGSSVYYGSLRCLAELVKSYSVEKIKEIVSIKLMVDPCLGEPLPEGW